MKYESVEAALAGTPQFTDESCKTLKYMINTKVNPIDNDKFNILASKSCLDANGNPIWYQIASDSVSTINEVTAKYAQEWVDEYYNK